MSDTHTPSSPIIFGPPIPPKLAARKFCDAQIKGKYKPEALHTYTDAVGSPVYWRIRARRANGEKWVRPMKLNGKGYELGEPEFPAGKPLYRLHALAAQPGAPAWFVEGENCADALARIGVLATTAGSASSDDQADFSPLAGRTVTLWPDNDAAGNEHMARVAVKLAELGCEVETLDVRALGLPDKGDAMDWLKERVTTKAADLATLPRLRNTSTTTIKSVTTKSPNDGKHQPGNESASASDAWPDPTPLPDALPPVAAFDFDLLPTSLRPWVQDIAERVQCPPDFPAVGAMISLAAVVGRKVGIRPKRQDDWIEVPNLWGAIVGRPGVMKSPALREVLKPLRNIEAKALASFEDEARDWQQRRELSKLKREAARSKVLAALKGNKVVDSDALGDNLADDEPHARRYVVNDCTVEALGEILRYNPNGTLAYRDELIGLLKSLDKEGNEGARGFFLSAWAGTDGHTFDRIGRGLNMRIEACCVSLLGSIQPAIIGGYLRQAVAGGGGDGLLARFQLLVWPDIAGEWRDVDRWPDSEAKASAFATFERLDTLDPSSIGATVEEGVIPYLRFDPDAQALFSQWRADFEPRIRSGNDHAAFESHLSKYRKLVPALALLNHLADNPAGGAIGETALLKALAWAEYLESHARRAYASVTQAEVEGARALLQRIRRGEVTSPFVPRDVYLKHWACLSEPGQVHGAVRLLGDLDYLRKEEQATGGRPKAAIWINPKVRAAK